MYVGAPTLTDDRLTSCENMVILFPSTDNEG